MERIMAKVVRIDDVRKHPNADSLDLCMVGGWQVVAKLGEYKTGDIAIYCETDSWIPRTIAEFLYEGRTFNGVEEERLRTVKLRGELSQGLLLPLQVLEAEQAIMCRVGDNVTETLGIQKYEKPLPAALGGVAKGNFPSFIPKTDQERVQNLTRELENYQGEVFEVTIKLDGSSCTIYYTPEQQGVCSRNLDLVETEGNAFWQASKKYNVIEKLQQHYEATGQQLAVQGEVIAPNIQGNYEEVAELEWHVFDVFDIGAQRYLLPVERQQLVKNLGFNHVPVFHPQFFLRHSCGELLTMAEGEGMNKGVKREGLVFKHLEADFSFKAISNSYLLKNE